MILLNWNFQFAISQENLDQYKPPVPASPTAASLGKYGEFQVGYGTGALDFKVPLYTLKEGEFELPIYLSYMSKGFKVNEIPSWVGLGWTLNCGGVIVRNQRGLTDEKRYNNSLNDFESLLLNTDPELGYFSTAKVLKKDFAKVKKNNILRYKFTEGYYDSKPDVFTYNFNGRSGKIIFGVDDNGDLKPKVLSKDNIKVSFKVDLSSWELTTDDGVCYVFSDAEISAENLESVESDKTVTTSWYLSKIKLPNGNAINFEYNNDVVKYETYSESVHYREKGNIVEPPMTVNDLSSEGIITSYRHSTRKISRIYNNKVEVRFNSLKERKDLKEKALLLDNIQIRSFSSPRTKNYKFYYGYFDSRFAHLENKPERYLNLRLRLDSICAKAGEQILPYYGFEYNTDINLPTRISYAQDYWGYYNGYLSNDRFGINQFYLARKTSFVPARISGFGSQNYNRDELTNCSVRDSYKIMNCQAANILNKIKYPTGGYSTFEFEPDEYSYLTDVSTLSDTIFRINRTNILFKRYPVDAFNTYSVKKENVNIDANRIEIDLQFDKLIQTSPEFKAILKITGPNGFNFVREYTKEGAYDEIIYDFQSGSYLVSIEASGVRVSMSINSQTKSIDKILKKKPLGTVRIKKISNWDNNKIVKQTEFLYEEAGISSGKLMNRPEFEYRENYIKAVKNTGKHNYFVPYFNVA
jgi:hypothetical protein